MLVVSTPVFQYSFRSRNFKKLRVGSLSRDASVNITHANQLLSQTVSDFNNVLWPCMQERQQLMAFNKLCSQIQACGKEEWAKLTSGKPSATMFKEMRVALHRYHT